MAIQTGDNQVAAMAGASQRKGFLKTVTIQAVSAWHGSWLASGIPGAAATPSSGAAGDVPTRSTAGAIPFTNPTGGNLTYLGLLESTATANMSIELYDRLWHNSGLSPTTLTAQTVNSVALTRPDANGADVELWMEVYGTLGVSTTVPTVSYTDQDGNSGNTATLIGFASAAATGRNFPFTLASGDTGVRSIQSYTNGATMTSGTFGLVLRRQIMILPIPNSTVGEVFDGQRCGMPRVYDDACLEFLVQAPATGSPIWHGQLALWQG